MISVVALTYAMNSFVWRFWIISRDFLNQIIEYFVAGDVFVGNSSKPRRPKQKQEKQEVEKVIKAQIRP